MPFIKSLVSKRLAYYFKPMAVILLLGKIMPTYSRYTEKGLVYIAIIAPLGCQPFSYTKCTKLNIYLSCNIYLVSNIEYIFLTRFCALRSL